MVKLNLDIPDSFLEEEVRCEYTVTRQMKELWAVELDLLSEFDRVCKKYHLKYAADAGTLLGAVRHHGFIPWDDDLDLAMPRDDYEKLLEIAPSVFNTPYYLESFQNEKCFVYDKAKLLNLHTTGFENNLLEKHAIFIDIFPYDNIVDDSRLLEKQGLELNRLFANFQRIVTCSKKWYRNENGICLLRKIARNTEYFKNILLGRNVGGKHHCELFRRMQSISKHYNGQRTKYIGALAEYHVNVVDLAYSDDFDNLIEVDFEFMKIPIVSHYDETLRRLYGDYRKFVMGTQAHSFKIIDTSRPYTEVLKERGIKYE